MNLKALMLILTAACSLPTYAARDFDILLNLDSAADILNETERTIRELSDRTGNGEVGTRTRRGYVTANFSDDAAKTVRQLPGVLNVIVSVQFEPFRPGLVPVRTADNLNRLISFREDRNDSELRALRDMVRTLAARSGNGYFAEVSDRVVVANLRSKDASDLALVDGITSVAIDPGKSRDCTSEIE